MSLILEVFKWFGFGVIAFFLIPLLAALLPWTYAKRIVGLYQTIAMSLLGRAIMLKRTHGGLKLKKSTFDAEVDAEKIRLGRSVKHFRDPHNYMSTFRGYPFGLAHESRAAIVDARTAFFGGRFKRLIENDQFARKGSGRFKAFFAIERGLRELVNLDDVKAVIQRSAKPGYSERQKDIAEKSQIGFNSKQFLIDQMTWFTALGVGFGLRWFIEEAGGATDGVGSSIAIFIGGFPL